MSQNQTWLQPDEGGSGNDMERSGTKNAILEPKPFFYSHLKYFGNFMLSLFKTQSTEYVKKFINVHKTYIA